MEVLDGNGKIVGAVLGHAERRSNAKGEFSANHAARVLERLMQRPGEVGFGAMREDEAGVKGEA
jgi:hypothetical protein